MRRWLAWGLLGELAEQVVPVVRVVLAELVGQEVLVVLEVPMA